MTREGKVRVDLGAILDKVQATLRDKGIDMNVAGDIAACCGDAGDTKVKVVCIAPGLRDSMQEMGKAPRDQVVMVRVDEATSTALDAWVETGAVKSRSEAAALFIREGLKLRSDELEQLRDALGDVENARQKLKRRAREIFGAGDDPNGEEGSSTS